MSTSTSPKFTPRQSEDLFQKALEAGLAAGGNALSTPMTVVQRENPFDDNSPIVKRYEPVADGVCGFAWINVKPGNSSFARWLKANTHAKADRYYGGVSYWVRGFGQSYERKLAFARAFAGVLTEAGVQAHGTGRLD